MLVKKVKLVAVGEVVPYYKNENEENGNEKVAGCRRQLIFESMDFKKDVIPITLFNDEARGFCLDCDTVGELQFQCEKHERVTKNGNKRMYPEFRLINFIPS